MTVADRASQLIRVHRKSTLLAVFVLAFLSILVLNNGNQHVRDSTGKVKQHVSSWLAEEGTISPYSHFNGFEHFKKTSDCSFSSLDIYQPTKRVCGERGELLDAMSWGGRIGFDAPYQSRDCDMRWFTTSEICAIFGQFSKIHLIGDSMVRHLSQAFNVLLREDLPTGARSTWRTNEENSTCYCRTLFENHDCYAEGFAAANSRHIIKHDPMSYKCPAHKLPEIDFHVSNKDPPSDMELDDLKKYMSQNPVNDVFILGQGGWDGFEVDPARRWVSAYEGVLEEKVQGFRRPPPPPPPIKLEDPPAAVPPPIRRSAEASPQDAPASHKPQDSPFGSTYDLPPRLWISPNAQGIHKNQFFVFEQNNIKLMKFEREMRSWLNERAFDSLGMYNLTVQSESKDGTHATMESNLVKAMMVMNWLDMVAKEKDKSWKLTQEAGHWTYVSTQNGNAR